MKNNTIFKKAYIQRINGEYVNDASFYYTNGLRLLGIPVEFFDEDKPYNLKLGRDIIVVAGVPTTLKVLSQMGIEPPSPLDIPEGLYEYCGRNILRGRLQEFLNSPLAKYPMFVKPAQHGKLFNGQIVSCKEELEMFKYCHELGVKIPIISSEPVNFISEYRCFVMKDKTGVFSILDCRRYRGDYQKIPDFSIIENAIKDYKNSPVAYAIDFGVTDDGRTLLVECNDAYSLGPYGCDSLMLTQMFIARWEELLGNKLLLYNK